MILTVGMSPCVDVTVRLNKFALGKTNVAGEKIVTYAGKANNVALGVSRLGGAAFVTGFMYNENGSLFEKALDKEGIPFSFIWNPGRVRENYKFIDGKGHDVRNAVGCRAFQGDGIDFFADFFIEYVQPRFCEQRKAQKSHRQRGNRGKFGVYDACYGGL